MKLVKSLLLGSVAGLAAVAGAQAADLPAKKAAPVEYVRVCSTYGAGFFYIPGTETCLRVGGRVRADYLYGEPLTRGQDAVGFRARGRIQLDARTATAYGLLRTFVRFEITRSSGTPFGLGNTGTISTSPNVAEAFVQFGGLTAGRVVSFFSNGDLPTGHMGTLRFDDAPDVDLLAYTFTFGNGFSATISLEDGIERREGLRFGDTWAAAQYAGQRAPDLVGNIKYTGTWGTAQLSGAIHQIRSNNLLTFTYPGIGSVSDYPDTEYGFAIAGYVGVNLPQLAPGDALWLAATFADGAPAYLDGGNSGTVITPFAAFENGTPTLVDGSIDPVTGDLKKTRAWAIAGGLRHYWTPTIRSNFFGSYLSSDSRQAFNTPADFREYRLGANVFWQPVSGLDLGVEVIYANTDLRGINPATGIGFRNSNGWEGRFRVQRDF
ncbi:porin [Microvirga rosea]|uniref:porin n=1 Tax=Microvirga rosea TaxID=2715425 RepID=UPI001D0AB384|nr:porin [Microvirga rosea]MCB8819860.1 porin [Microvirga rosea]